MTKAGDMLVNCCESMRSLPAAVMCLLFYILQSAIMDYYLVHYIGSIYLTWLSADIPVFFLIIFAILLAYISLQKRTDDEQGISVAWIAWVFYGISLSSKIVIVFMDANIRTVAEKPDFFGHNTLKATIAVTGVIFLLLLITQHDAPLGSERRRYIENLTGTVLFDVLDTVDILDVLFDEEVKKFMWPAFDKAILTVAIFNLMVPALPLFTLSYTKFGRNKLRMKLLYMHRLALVLLVNVPNLLLRMILWHGFSAGVTPFILKNAILIAMVLFEFYEHKREKFYEHKIEEAEKASGLSRSSGTLTLSNGKLSEAPSSRYSDESERYVYDEDTGRTLTIGANGKMNYIDEGFVMENRVMSFV